MNDPRTDVGHAIPADGRGARLAVLGHRGAIVWLTGLSGAGKSTLAAALEAELLRQRIVSVVLDGDRLRTGLSRGLGFSAIDREENVRRAAEAALLVATAGLAAIVALISPFRAGRAAAAARADALGVPFAEVFVNAPLSVCEARDPKGLYRQARAGAIREWTGLDSPYEAPVSPALELHTDVESVKVSTRRLTTLALFLARPAVSGSPVAES